MNTLERYDLIRSRMEGVDAALADTADLITQQEELNQSIRTDALLLQTTAAKKKANQLIATLADLNETKDSLITDRKLLIEALASVNTEIQTDKHDHVEAVEVQFSESLPEDVIDAQADFVEAFARFYALSHIQARRQGTHIDQRGLFNYTFHPEQGNIGQFNSLVDQYRAEYHEKMEAAA